MQKNFTKEWARRRLAEIRKENMGTQSPNAIELLFKEIADIPSDEMYYVGNLRSNDVAVWLENGSRKIPDYRFKDQHNKVVEVIGTYSHDPADEYAAKLVRDYFKVGVDCFAAIEPEIVNNPQEMHNRIRNFYGKCPNCGQPLHTLGTEPPYCGQCGTV